MNSILLVEDNKAIIMGLSYLFNENGYKTIVAENIEEAGSLDNTDRIMRDTFWVGAALSKKCAV